MAYIELAIKVDERDVDFVRKNFKPTGYSFIPLHIQTEFVSAILNGVSLPKGHGRLGDLDKIEKEMQNYHDDCAKTSKYTKLGFETAIAVVEDARTIIEADEEVQE